MKKSGNEQGFSLIEVVVALSILAISVTVLMRVFSGAMLATKTSSAYYTALEIAESRLALLIAKNNPIGVDSGETDAGFRWQTRATNYHLDNSSPLSTRDDFTNIEMPFASYHFEIEVQWGVYRTYRLELSTLRLGPANDN